MNKTFARVLMGVLSLASIPLMATGNNATLTGGQGRLYTVEAKGRTLRDILSEVAGKGGPKTHYDKSVGEKKLNGQYSASDWRSLMSQLLMGYNYYMVLDGKGNRIKDIFIVDNAVGDGAAKDVPASVTTANNAAFPCTDGGPSRMPFGHKGPLAMMRQLPCEGESTPVR